jgi:hypothetical protein
MAVAALLEGLQAFTPDRAAYLPAVFYGAGGALAAALVVELFMRAWNCTSRLSMRRQRFSLDRAPATEPALGNF